MPIALPDEPNLSHLRNQAKALRRAVRSGDPAALAEVADLHPAGRPDGAAAPPFLLGAAQLVVARRYGFASWVRLKRHVEAVGRYSRFPDRMGADDAGPADRFLRLACLSYEDDGPERWGEAHQLLIDQPEITEGDVSAAAAAADLPALRRILDADAGAARREGGPYRWEPLVYLAYARHDPAIDADAVIGCARLLLEAGADPDAGYLWHGLTSPFTVLTGVFGEGEAGPVRWPRHPHWLALGRLLLQGGADPNDAQALYNRMFEPDDDHLGLLFEFGLGSGGPGPWSQRLPGAAVSPTALVRGQLAWAITHGMAARVRILVDHGVDVVSAFDDGLSPTESAAIAGHPELIDLLEAHGAVSPVLSASQRLIAAALSGDRETVGQLQIDHPGLVDRVRSARPGLMAWAAASGGSASVELLVDLQFDVDAKGRTDVPRDQPWHTALHYAAEKGDLELAGTLLRLGADPDVKDARFDATPLGWARHFGHEQLIELLTPLTTPEASDASGG